MQWSAERWQSAFRGVPAHPAGLTSSRIDLRVQAIDFASRGWSVLPGTFPRDGEWLGRRDRQLHGPTPVQAEWQEQLGADLAEVMSWWDEHPYNLLLATGLQADAVEVDAALGRQAAKVLRAGGFPVPIVATPSGSWFFLTTPGGQLNDELAGQSGIRLHGRGSWAPLPPSVYSGGAVHWRVKPEVCAWRLPSSEFVQDALRTALEIDHQPDDVAALLPAGR
ncbi:bifunctional DNA primase/polymerase [Saccharopolyspora tripterygii]